MFLRGITVLLLAVSMTMAPVSKAQAYDDDIAALFLIAAVGLGGLAIGSILSDMIIPTAAVVTTESSSNIKRMTKLQQHRLDGVKSHCGVEVYRALGFALSPNRKLKSTDFQRITKVLANENANEWCLRSVQALERAFPVEYSASNKVPQTDHTAPVGSE
ncbi:MAG TPA: hypothetical protein VFV50_09325 [Bdellovibrionales bacterium]|nr:hypothetical protein [Bdellovibrionales bacterium]